MADFNEFLNVLKDAVLDFASQNWKDQLEAVTADGNAFIDKAKEDLMRWTQLLAEKKISANDLEWLVKGKKDLAEMEALKQAGLAQVKIDSCKAGLVDLVIKTALKFFL